MNTDNDKWSTLESAVFVLGFGFGWWLNISKIDVLDLEGITRIISAIIVPVGAVLGYF